MKNFKRSFYILFFSVCVFLAPKLSYAALPNVDFASDFYFLIDADTKEVLLSKNADVRMAPSSMTKLMTAYVVFDQIKKGKASFNKQCIVAKEAWRKSGSSMFLNYGDVVSLEDLLKGLLVVSGNDAAIALSYSLAGSVDNFVALMNLYARDLGLKNSHFKNPHGLNEDGHYMTLRDLSTLAIRLYQDFPQYVYFFEMPEFTYRNITQHNRNPLIRQNYEGKVGGKTGHTNEGGYGMVATVKRGSRRLVAVVNKAKTAKQRSAIAIDMLDYGFANYKKLVLFEKDVTVANLYTWLGTSTRVEAITNHEIAINLPRNYPTSAIKVFVKYKEPIYAPIAKGAKIADLVVDFGDGVKTVKFSLFAKENIDKARFIRRIRSIVSYKMHTLF